MPPVSPPFPQSIHHPVLHCLALVITPQAVVALDLAIGPPRATRASEGVSEQHGFHMDLRPFFRRSQTFVRRETLFAYRRGVQPCGQDKDPNKMRMEK